MYAELACQNLPWRDPDATVPAHHFAHIAAWQEWKRLLRIEAQTARYYRVTYH